MTEEHDEHCKKRYIRKFKGQVCDTAVNFKADSDFLCLVGFYCHLPNAMYSKKHGQRPLVESLFEETDLETDFHHILKTKE